VTDYVAPQINDLMSIDQRTLFLFFFCVCFCFFYFFFFKGRAGSALRQVEGSAAAAAGRA
jgi:hypothetical protein